MTHWVLELKLLELNCKKLVFFSKNSKLLRNKIFLTGEQVKKINLSEKKP